MTIEEKNSVKDLTFERALEHLENIVKKMENSKLSLDEAISLYEKGNKLKEFCEKKLHEANLKVEKIIKNEDGTSTISSFDEETIS